MSEGDTQPGDDDERFCILDGDPDGYVTRREANRMVRLWYRLHVQPVKADLAKVKDAVLDPKHGLHTLRRFIVWTGVGIVALAAAALRIVEFMRNMGAM
jgi:hypothetical protein